MAASKPRAPMRFCAIDCEGDASADGWRGGSWYCDDSHGFIDDHASYIAQLRQLARSGYTFAAHNAEYDVSVIFWSCRENVRVHYYNKSFNHAEWFHSDKMKPCHIWDTVKLSGGLSLAALSKSLHLPKFATPPSLLSTPTDVEPWQCDRHGAQFCIECYAVRDAEIVHAFMGTWQQLARDFNIQPKRTPPAMAAAIWRAIEQPQPIAMRENTMSDLSRQGYYGGRVDTFKLGTLHGVHCADVTSMYPYVMLNKPMCEPRAVQFNASRFLTDRFIQYEGATDCTVRIPPSYVPVLPVKTNGKLMFVVGTVRGVWVNAELRAAIARGVELLKVHACVYAADVCYPFARFIATMMARRAEHMRLDNPIHLTDKRILNSLYGRMGMQEEQVEETIRPMPPQTSTRDFPHSEIGVRGGVPLLLDTVRRAGLQRWSNVLWAASITAYARLHLLSYIEAQGNDIIYCDTDSIISLQPVVGLGNGLGELADEGQWNHALVLAPKMYRLWNDDGASKVRAKGVRQSFADAYIRGEVVEYDQPYRPREGAGRGVTPGVWHAVHKQRRLGLGKRLPLDVSVLRDYTGWSDTVPWSASWSSLSGTNDLAAI